MIQELIQANLSGIELIHLLTLFPAFLILALCSACLQ